MNLDNELESLALEFYNSLRDLGLFDNVNSNNTYEEEDFLKLVEYYNGKDSQF